MQENYQDLEKLRKELRMTRIFSTATFILLICVLIGGFIVFSKIQEYMTIAMPLIEEMAEALENFNEASESLENFTDSIKNFSQKLEAVLISEAFDYLRV